MFAINKINRCFLAICMFGIVFFAQGQTASAVAEKNVDFKTFLTQNVDYRIQTHFSIGGSSPLGLPQEIRKIESYNPTLKLGLEANATIWPKSDSKVGYRVGLRVENKGMRTNARVKNYLTGIIQNQSQITGYFTGNVETNVNNTYITVPALVVYRFNSDVHFYGGLYASAAIFKTFDGYVSNGYLRQDTPVGTKISFEGDNRADYDFSDEVKTFQYGTQLGAEWLVNSRLVLFSDVTFGLSGVLNSDFQSISFNLHNIFLNTGFGYRF